MKDLVLLVADKNAQFALQGALSRPEALEIRPIEFEFRVHSGRDGGARKTGPELLALQRKQFRRALLVLDFEGCGTDRASALELEAELDARLATHWRESAKSIVIEPELDVWVWGSDAVIESSIEWPPGIGVRQWLDGHGFIFGENGKPERPREALQEALKKPRLPRSSAIYLAITKKISLRRCSDGSFKRLRQQLIEWFPHGNDPLF